MSLQNLIQERILEHDLSVLSQVFNYDIARFTHRLEKTLESPYLALDEPFFDFNCVQRVFLLRLCTALQIPYSLYQKVIDDIDSELSFKKNRFKSYILIKTNFKRKNEPIFMLSAFSKYLAINVDEHILDMKLNDQVDHIKDIVIEHYKSQTSLPVWGEIKGYEYHYSEQLIIRFTTSGQIINE